MARALLDAPRPFVYGLAGSQGAGKSMIARTSMRHFRGEGLKVATLSIDDLYLGREVRRRLAADTHALFITRGPPGTHDVDRGVAILDSLKAQRATPLPRFSKALDDPLPMAGWEEAPAGLDLLIFEGWCLGARPQEPPDLEPSVNMLEEVFDSNGRWRRMVNANLAGAYQTLFARIDRLAYLRPPSFEIVKRWRFEAEQEIAGGDAGGFLAEDEIDFFVQHYERITRHMMEDLPARADLAIMLDERRRALESTS